MVKTLGTEGVRRALSPGRVGRDAWLARRNWRKTISPDSALPAAAVLVISVQRRNLSSGSVVLRFELWRLFLVLQYRRALDGNQCDF